MMASNFKHVAGMSLATGMVIGGGAAAFSRGVARARAWQEACDAEAIRQDEVGAFQKLLTAFRRERGRAQTAEAKAKALEAELNHLRVENLRLLRAARQ